ncbi:MAG: hypothetical protein JXA99_12950 [Candidatus Lokiarchaeota archaeon]|nr:hypothetical protein [Candidatus Lokiarchaeota archaeon]
MYYTKEFENLEIFKNRLEEIKKLKKNSLEDKDILITKDPIYGKYIKIDGIIIAVDCWNPKADIIFISHGHMDHIPNIPENVVKDLFEEKIKIKFICSKITREIAKYRTRNRFDFPQSMWLLGEDLTKENSIEYKGIKITLIKNGHTYGSTSLLIEGSKKILYTSDFTTRDREFLNGNKIIYGLKSIKCDILIMECTFGSPQYIFPSFLELQNDLNEYINEQLFQKYPIILLAYSFGKSQIILNMLNIPNEIPLLLENNIAKTTEILEHNGIQFLNWEPYRNYNKKQLMNLNEYICIIPPYSMFNDPFKSIISNRAKVILFSGKVLNKSYQNEFKVDKYVPYSDHCDFNELLTFINGCKAKIIYLEHGFTKSFSYSLSKNRKHSQIFILK